MIAKFRWHCISFFSIVRNVNHFKKFFATRDTKVVINHRVGNFILNSMLSYLNTLKTGHSVARNRHKICFRFFYQREDIFMDFICLISDSRHKGFSR